MHTMPFEMGFFRTFCVSVDKISTNTARRAVPLRYLSLCIIG